MINRSLYLDRIRPFINQELVKVITGIRRCGKSVMLELIQRELKKSGVDAESMLTYNFESLTLSHLCTAEALHKDVLEKAKAITGRVYLFFDELATYLAGRYVEFVMYPLSFREFCEAMHEKQPDRTVADCFHLYMQFGGMPYLGNLQYQAEPVKQYLQDLYNAV